MGKYDCCFVIFFLKGNGEIWSFSAAELKKRQSLFTQSDTR
jgi:hypothetical protein